MARTEYRSPSNQSALVRGAGELGYHPAFHSPEKNTPVYDLSLSSHWPIRTHSADRPPLCPPGFFRGGPLPLASTPPPNHHHRRRCAAPVPHTNIDCRGPDRCWSTPSASFTPTATPGPPGMESCPKSGRPRCSPLRSTRSAPVRVGPRASWHSGAPGREIRTVPLPSPYNPSSRWHFAMASLVRTETVGS